MMRRDSVIGIIVVAVIVVAVIFLISSGGDIEGTDMGETTQEVPAPGSEGVDEMIVSEGADDSEPAAPVEQTGPRTHIVEMTSKGFSPEETIINQGDTVNFINAGESRWPATNVHPTHTVYPGSSASKCGGADELSSFDSCGPTDDYSFTFDLKGRWRYHDHFSPGKGGIIVVLLG